MVDEPTRGAVPRFLWASPRPRPGIPAARVVGDDIDRMRSRLFLRDESARSAFWVLLVLAAVIAGSGVVADSDATVIGAMIVAPLMTPILGTALAVVLAERRQLVVCVGYVLVGAAAVVAIGFLLGLLVAGPVVADDNSQVASRVSPRLIDLVSALATGAVGAFALVRSDVSDALPGVAIAISLVPPLSVVGLTLESGAPGQAAGALLLFGTNVAAIVATGTAVMLGFRVRAAAARAGRHVGRLRGRTLVVIPLLVVLVTIPLCIGSYQVIHAERVISTARPVVEQWAEAQGWAVATVGFTQGQLQIEAIGPPPSPDAGQLRDALDAAGLEDVEARLSLVIGGTQELP
jgi:uncharacterized hydrophobic protein (TIGR00271 family)